jgi:hypothetical protein
VHQALKHVLFGIHERAVEIKDEGGYLSHQVFFLL